MTRTLSSGSATVASPSAWIELQREVDTGATIVTVTGTVGHGDAAVLSRCLHAELDERPVVMVVDLRAVTTGDPSWVNVLAVVRARARTLDVGFHLLDERLPAPPPALLEPSTLVGSGGADR